MTLPNPQALPAVPSPDFWLNETVSVRIVSVCGSHPWLHLGIIFDASVTPQPMRSDLGQWEPGFPVNSNVQPILRDTSSSHF